MVTSPAALARNRRSGRLRVLLLTFALLFAAGCSGGGNPSTSPAASDGAPTGEVAVDKSATLTVDPVGSDGNGSVSAVFSQPAAGRQVSLQSRSDSAWSTVGTAAEDASGKAVFSAPSGVTYRAVAVAADGAEAVATPTVAADKQYRPILSDDFADGAVDANHWAPRYTGVYIGSRKCSAPSPDMISFADGSLRLSVNASSAAQTAKAKAAATKLGAKASNPCPNGAFDNAMLATEGKVAFRYGIVSVRMKFPPNQGMHGSAWLQSTDGTDEIDFIESFGLGKGIQYKLHSKQSDGTMVDSGGYIKNIPDVANAEWWDEFHIATVEWTADEYVFLVDGQVVYKTSEGVSKSDKFLILSLLTSDWELPRLDASKLPASMDVDWVRIYQR